MKAVYVNRKDIVSKPNVPYEEAVRQFAEEIKIGPDHPAFGSLDVGCLACIGGVIYGLTVEDITRR